MDLLATQPDPANAPQTPAQPNATTSSTSLPADQAAVPAVVHPDVPADSSANPVADIATQTSTAEPAVSNLPAMSDDAPTPVTPPAPVDLPATPTDATTTNTGSDVASDDSQAPTDDESELTVDDILNKDLLDLMGVKGLKDEDKKALYETMLKTIQARVAERLSDSLSDEDFDKWKDLDQEAKQKFLEQKDIDAAQMFLEETVFYKTEMAEIARAAQQKLKADLAAKQE